MGNAIVQETGFLVEPGKLANNIKIIAQYLFNKDYGFVL